MSRALLVLALALLQATAAAPRFDSNRAWDHLTRIVGLGPRPAGSPAIEETRRYIRAQLAAAVASGAKLSEQSWDDTTPAGPVHMVNLLVTIPGQSSDRIVVAGHYDTKRYREFRFVGANDGGSSAAFLIELARVLSQRHNRLTIEILFLDGEEAVGEWEGTDHTYGSRHYVANARTANTLRSLKALILVDMIGDRDLRFRRELNSTPWLTDIVWSAARSAGHEEHFSREGIEIEDDHLPFLEAGVPAVDLIDFDYEAWHTPLDTIDRVGARSLQVVGDVLLAALPQIEQH